MSDQTTTPATSDVATMPDRLIHFTDPPYTHGLCGTVLPEDGRFRGYPVSCVVCLDLNESDG